MSYIKQNFVDGNPLYADELNHIENGIKTLETQIRNMSAEDGYSPTVAISKSGIVTTINITDVYGTKTATIYDGVNGQAPVKGVDYFTEAEKAEIVADVIATGGGISTAQSNSLWAILQKTAFTSQLTSAELSAFKTAWGVDETVEPDIPDDVTLTSISAVYTGGDVATGTAVTDITGVTVTATYSDGTTATVTGYTLSGDIVEGENTITVSYGGKTTTFTVTGIVESGGDDVTAELVTDGLLAHFDLRNAVQTDYDWHWSFAPTVGEGDFYLNTSGGTKGTTALLVDEKGLGNAPNIMSAPATYPKSEIISVTTPFTMFVFGYVAEKAFYRPKNYGNASNTGVLYILTVPYLDTAGATKTVTISSGLPTIEWNKYVDLCICVSAEAVRFYIDGVQACEVLAIDCTDFSAWIAPDSSIADGNNNAKTKRLTSVSIYNRALNIDEIVEMHEYLKTLEVA